MIVRPEHLNWNFEKRDKLKAELEEAVAKGELSKADMDYLLSSEEDFGPFVERVEDQCFVCGEKLTLPAVMWHGHHGTKMESLEIWFHPECIEGWAQRLVRDSNELKHGKPAADAILTVWKKTNEKNA